MSTIAQQVKHGQTWVYTQNYQYEGKYYQEFWDIAGIDQYGVAIRFVGANYNDCGYEYGETFVVDESDFNSDRWSLVPNL